jgi:hypothetical protein
MTRDSPTAPRAGQTASYQNRAPQMVKPRSPEPGKWKVNEGRNKKLIFKPTFDYLLNKYINAGPKDRAMKRPRSLIRQERRERLKQTNPEAKGKGAAKEGYNPRISQSSHFAHPFGYPGASSSTGFPVNQMQWCPSLLMSTYLIWDPYCQIWENYLPMMLRDWDSREMTESIHPLVNKTSNQSMKKRMCSRAKSK